VDGIRFLCHNAITLHFDKVHQVAAPVGHQTSSIWSISSECGTEGKVCYLLFALFLFCGFPCFIPLPQGGAQSIVISMSVCLSAHITRKPQGRSLPNFLCMLPVAVAQSSDGVVIRYVLLDLRMTLYFCSMVPVGQNQAWHYTSMKIAKWQQQLDIRQLVLGQMWHRGQSLLSQFPCYLFYCLQFTLCQFAVSK